MSIKERIESLLNPIMEAENFFIVNIIVKPSKASQRVTILVDNDEGITIQECTSISRRLAKQLEELEVFTEAYNLEVSSPGLDQPLILMRQYKKNIGRNLKITLKSGDVLTGKLIEAADDKIKIQLPEPKKKPKAPVEPLELEKEIDLEEISKAMIEISFK